MPPPPLPPTTTTHGPFRLRPGRPSDIASLPNLYDVTLGPDALVDMLFPLRHKYPRDYLTGLYRLFEARYWSLEWVLTVVVVEEEGVDGQKKKKHKGDRIVGFTWWKRPVDEISVSEQWFTGFSWISPLLQTYIRLKNRLLPLHIDAHAAKIFDRAFSLVKASLFTTHRRRTAWYLSTLAVHPDTQGRGLGGWLMREGLAAGPGATGKAAWLIGLRATDAFYEGFGFRERGRANVGELSGWDGGIVMFRE